MAKLRIVENAADDAVIADETIPDSEKYRTQACIAELLSVSRRTVARWIERHGAPARTPKGYDVRAWIKWHGAHELERHKRQAEQRSPDVQYKIARAGRMQHETARLKAGLVDAGDATRQRKRIAQWFLAEVAKIGAGIEPELRRTIGKRAAREAREFCDGYAKRTRERCGKVSAES